ncbi:MAG: cyclase family protein [Clostridia bacterium]|nr:cyclase family protein [Clostridia bacterium]
MWQQSVTRDGVSIPRFTYLAPVQTRVYDISQELFSCCVYPGDPAPTREVLCSFDTGSPYHLTAFSMCAHNGTHIDAPYHFIPEGKTVDQLSLAAMVGPCYVAEYCGCVDGAAMRAIWQRAAQSDPGAAARILIKGDAYLSEEGAAVLREAGVLLYGNESQTVGPEEAPMAVHLMLLGAGVVLLEGIRLCDVPEGTYLLSAAPINLGGAEGAPCRAVLLER